MKTVKLLGELGKEFGKTFKLDISTPAEAIRALCVNFPAMKDHLLTAEKRGVAYRVIVGSEDQKLEDLHSPSGKQIIKFVPVIQGAGGGTVQFILGAAIFAASFLDVSQTVGTYMKGVGIAMMVGGAVQMLSPVPSAYSQDQNNNPDNKPSYTFNGAVNTSAQGYPVPVGYGRMIVGSAVISAGISVENFNA